MTDPGSLVEQGNALKDAGDFAGAESAYRSAIALASYWSVPHFNLGLLCKHQGRWQESLEFNSEAVRLDATDEGAWWNLGIAATALGNWSEARRAWKACGMEPPAGAGPPEFNFGPTPVRLAPHGRAEVVCAHRIDPARARVLSIPTPALDHNHGDIVLTDGSIDGRRIVDGREYAVFNVLALLTPSPLKKYVVELATSDEKGIAALEDCAGGMGGAAENWGMSTKILCEECSRGTPHEHHTGERVPAHPHCGLAAKDDDHAESILRAWLQREPTADLIRWYDAASSAL